MRKKAARKKSAARRASASASGPDPASVTAPEAPSPVRLNKWLADRGIASRRACDQLILDGRVEVNGERIRDLGLRIDPGVDLVKVDGESPPEVEKVYYLLYKPKGVVCTNGVSGGKPRAIDLLSEQIRQRVYCVGRLDEDSEGLIILTNDGEFAQLVAHPRHQIAKTYHLRVHGLVSREEVDRIRKGIHLSEGRTGGAQVRVLKRTQSFTRILVTIREGRNRELRRIFARLKHPVRSLTRVRIGPIASGRIKKGNYRRLDRGEVELLRQLALESRAPRAKVGPAGSRRAAPGAGNARAARSGSGGKARPKAAGRRKRARR